MLTEIVKAGHRRCGGLWQTREFANPILPQYHEVGRVIWVNHGIEDSIESSVSTASSGCRQGIMHERAGFRLCDIDQASILRWRYLCPDQPHPHLDEYRTRKGQSLARSGRDSNGTGVRARS